MANESERCVDILLEFANRIEKLLTNLNNSPPTKDDVLAGLSRELINDTQEFINENRSVLPSYMLMKINKLLQRLEEKILESSKSKLSFKFKAPTNKTNVAVDGGEVVAAGETVQRLIEPSSASSSSFILMNKNGGHYSHGPEDLHSKDLSLINLRDCTVRLIGSANTVYVRDLHNVGATIVLACRAITIANCNNCQFRLACQQLRIDSTTDCQFEVFNSSRSMIESSKALTFTELKLDSLRTEIPTLDTLIQSSGFDINTNNWKLIDDFDWLSPDVPSQNFKLKE